MRSSDDSSPAGGPPVQPSGLSPATLKVAGVVVLGSIMSILDTTIVNVAIRTLSREFGASLEATQWIATGYMLALASVIPLTGWAADRFGTKRLYMVSILLFLIGSALSGAAWSIGSLILFRVLQGLGGGMIMPAGLIILSQAAGPSGMARLMSVIGVPMLLGPICGPILGGWFVDDFSWRWIFYVNIPVGFLALIAAQAVLPRDTPKPHLRLDWPGLLLLSPGLAIFVFGLAETAAAGNLSSARNDLCLAVGGVLIAAFHLHAWNRKDALIDIRLFTRPAPAAGAATTFFFGTAFFGSALLMPLYFQMIRNESAFHAGLLQAAQGLGSMISMPLAARLSDRVGPRVTVVTGLTVACAALATLTTLGADTPLPAIEFALFVNGIGIGGVMMPSMAAILGTIRRDEIPRATGGVNVLQRVGGSIGTALLTVILAHDMKLLSGGTTLQALRQHVPPALLAPLGHAFGHTFRWSLAILLLALASATRLPKGRLTPPGSAQPTGASPRNIPA